jgi:hypothetical protein
MRFPRNLMWLQPVPFTIPFRKERNGRFRFKCIDPGSFPKVLFAILVK